MKYRCKQSGNVIELTNPYDIESMKGHDNYEELKDGMQDEKREEASEKRQTLKLKKHERDAGEQ